MGSRNLLDVNTDGAIIVRWLTFITIGMSKSGSDALPTQNASALLKAGETLQQSMHGGIVGCIRF